MGVARKALLPLAGRPLLAHVLERIRPQAGSLLLSTEGETRDFDGFGLPLIPDLSPGHRGPLAGLYSAMCYLVDHGLDENLLLCPCDAPFVPTDLAKTLLAARRKDQVMVVGWRGVPQPTFSLWHTSHLAVIGEALLERGLGGPRQVLERLPHAVLEWPGEEPPPFFNINTPKDLDAAVGWLDHESR